MEAIYVWAKNQLTNLAFTKAGLSAGTSLTIGQIGGAVAVAATSQALLKIITPKANFGDAVPVGELLRQRLANVRDPAPFREYIYGEIRAGGYLALVETTGNDLEHLHLVILHASHECEELGDLYLNEELVPLTTAAEGSKREPTSGNKFENYVDIYDHLGSATQNHDSALAAASGRWSSFHDLKGICYTYARLTVDPEDNVWEGGIPTITRVVKGKKVYDPRTTTTVYSSNAALCIADYLTSDFGYGRYGVTNSDIASTEWIAAANVCDEDVTLDNNAWTTGERVTEGTLRTGGTGPVKLYEAQDTGTCGATEPTHSSGTVSDGTIDWLYVSAFTNTENRYELHGIVRASEDPIEVVRKLKGAMAGFVGHIGGEWILHAGAWRAPTVTLTESDFASGIAGQTKDDRRAAANRVRGLFADANSAYQLVEYPAVENSTYLTDDNSVESWAQLDLPYTVSHSMAQRIAKIELEKRRQEITHTARFKLKAMRIQCGDNFNLTFDKYGYSSKAFVCLSHTLMADSNGALVVEMKFRETASAVYDWSNGEETVLDPAPNTNLPDPWAIADPTGLMLDSGTNQLVAKGESIISRIKASWTAAVPNANIQRYEIQWKKNSAGSYEETALVPHNTTAYWITEADDGVAYDVRVRSVSSLNTGAWVEVTNHTVVGKSAAPTTPTGLAATARSKSVELLWNESSEADFQRFMVYHNTSGTAPNPATDTPTIQTDQNSAIITGLTNGTLYYFWVAAVDTSGNKSAISTQATATPTTIDEGEITSIPFSKITTGTIVDQELTVNGTGGGGLIKSNNYVAGTSGWQIDSDGAAEFDDITARGNLEVGTTGFVRSSGKNSHDSATAGFWLGYEAGGINDYTFGVGNSTRSITWDGTDFKVNGSVEIDVDKIIYGSEKILASGKSDQKTWQGPTFSGSGLFAQSAEGADSMLGLLNMGAAANTDIDLLAAFSDGTYASKSAVGGERHFDIGINGYDGSAWKNGGLIQLKLLGPVSGAHTAARTDIAIFPKLTNGTGDSYTFTPTGLEFSDGGTNEATVGIEATDRLVCEQAMRIAGDLYVGSTADAGFTRGAADRIDLLSGDSLLAPEKIYVGTTATYLDQISHESDTYLEIDRNVIVGSSGTGVLECGLVKSTTNGASYMRLRYGTSGGASTDIFLRINAGKIEGSTDGSSWNALW